MLADMIEYVKVLCRPKRAQVCRSADIKVQLFIKLVVFIVWTFCLQGAFKSKFAAFKPESSPPPNRRRRLLSSPVDASCVRRHGRVLAQGRRSIPS